MCCVVLTHTGLLVLYFASASPRAFAHAGLSSWDVRLSSLLLFNTSSSFGSQLNHHFLKKAKSPYYILKHHVPLR